ncbi:MAG: hypothetical protein IKW46_07595 [Bacteroidaceae bacterium]|nr:hypothetical protein [Bacteroidaceae bacterium]
MLTIEKTVLPSPEQWEIIIEGMRNPMNSWDKMDSAAFIHFDNTEEFVLGDADHALMTKLNKGGTEHSKYRRMLPVWVTINAPMFWWKEFDTYKIGTVANSCSTMHKIHSKPIEPSDFSIDNFQMEYLDDELELNDMFLNVVCDCEELRRKFIETGDKKYWKGLIELLPMGYNQKRTVMLNYEVMANIYKQRRNHKLDEWHTLCDWIENLPYADLITGGE